MWVLPKVPAQVADTLGCGPVPARNASTAAQGVADPRSRSRGTETLSMAAAAPFRLRWRLPALITRCGQAVSRLHANRPKVRQSFTPTSPRSSGWSSGDWVNGPVPLRLLGSDLWSASHPRFSLVRESRHRESWSCERSRMRRHWRLCARPPRNHPPTHSVRRRPGYQLH